MTVGRRWVAAAAAVVLLAGCTGDPDITADASPTSAAASPPSASRLAQPTRSATTRATATPAAGVTVARVIDGDTLVTSSGDTVRLSGIDTPERGQCGYRDATVNLERLTAGKRVVLVKAGATDRDRYGRVLRYVDVGGVDANLAQIEAELANARYDSRDGYGRHPREAAYVAADEATAHVCGDAAKPTPKRTPSPGPTAEPAPDRGDSYSSCAEARAAGAAPLRRGEPGYAPKLDRDGDGVACE